MSWLDDQAGRGAPDYLGEILVVTGKTRQHPAWSSLERWLPMQTTLRFAPRLSPNGEVFPKGRRDRIAGSHRLS